MDRRGLLPPPTPYMYRFAALGLAAILGGCSSNGPAGPGAVSGSSSGASSGVSSASSGGVSPSGALSGAAGEVTGQGAESTGSSGAPGSGESQAGSPGSPSSGAMASEAGAPLTSDATVDTGTSVLDGPGGEAFDAQTGALNVDYAGFLSKQDIVFNRPNTNPLYGLTVGNGRVGAIAWSQNGLTMQVSGVDTSQQTAFSAGLVNFATNPGMDTGYTRFQQRLSLYDGLLTTTYDSDRTVTILGSPTSEVIGIHVSDARTNVSSISIDLSLWDVSNLQNSGNVPDLSTWKTVAAYADSTGAGFSRGQTDSNSFGYTLAATVDGAPFTTQMTNGSDVRLSITPTTSYTIWIASATRLNAPNNDSVTQAKALLSVVKAAGYAATLAQYEAFWHAFWAKSFVQYSNAAGDADYLEDAYYLATYMIGAGAYGNYPFHFINGVFRATQDNTKWSNAYWYWNQRDVYNSFLTGNHPDVMSVFNGMYSRNQSAIASFTMTHFGFAGLWVPETMGWNGNADGTVGSDYTKNIFSTGTEAAANMYAQYQYTGDANYLSQTVYPFMKGVATFYQNKLSYDAGSGQYYMASSNAHETYWNVKDAITDLAAVRSLFPLVIQTAQALQVDAQLVGAWQKILSNLAPYPTDGTVYLPHDPPTVQASNDENVACELIWPYGVTGIDAPDYAMAVATWKARPFPYGNVWANDAIQAARLGLGDEANQGMKTMLQKYQNYPNGMTNNTNGVFEYLGVHVGVMNESLLQSYNGRIRVFPALPSDSTLVARFTLAAKGGFLVTAEREAGDVKYVGLKSLNGNSATVVNPWTNAAAQVRDIASGSIVLTSSAASLVFDTTAGGIYVIERTSKPLAGYTYAYVTGTPNQGAKSLTMSTSLGIGAAMQADAGE
jgi:alpha-L-fucosidase 2